MFTYYFWTYFALPEQGQQTGELKLHFFVQRMGYPVGLYNFICTLKGPLKYLVAMIRGCHARAILLPVVRKFFARFLASRHRPVAGSSRR